VQDVNHIQYIKVNVNIHWGLGIRTGKVTFMIHLVYKFYPYNTDTESPSFDDTVIKTQ